VLSALWPHQTPHTVVPKAPHFLASACIMFLTLECSFEEGTRLTPGAADSANGVRALSLCQRKESFVLQGRQLHAFSVSIQALTLPPVSVLKDNRGSEPLGFATPLLAS